MERIPRQLADKIEADEDMFIRTNPPRLQTVAQGYKWRTVVSWNNLGMETRCKHSMP